MNCILASIKRRLCINGDEYDELLTDNINSAYVLICANLHYQYESADKLPMKYKELIKSAVIIGYNMQGAEGTSSVSTDIAQSFNFDDMQDYIFKKMPFKPIV